MAFYPYEYILNFFFKRMYVILKKFFNAYVWNQDADLIIIKSELCYASRCRSS